MLKTGYKKPRQVGMVRPAGGFASANIHIEIECILNQTCCVRSH